MIDVSLTRKEHYLLMKALSAEIQNVEDSLRDYDNSDDRKYLDELEQLFDKLFR
jgi:hypothetical protein